MPNTYYTSPFGEVGGPRPWVNEADTKFNPDGLYHFPLILPRSKETDEFVAMIKAASQRSLEEQTADFTSAERKRWTVYNPVSPEEDAEGVATGRWVVSFKQNRMLTFKDGTTKEVIIAVKDASGKRDLKKAIFAGTELRASFTMRNSKMTSSKQMGVRLDYSAVQVRKLVGAQARDRFEPVDGYVDDRDQADFDPSEGPTAIHGDY